MENVDRDEVPMLWRRGAKRLVHTHTSSEVHYHMHMCLRLPQMHTSM